MGRILRGACIATNVACSALSVWFVAAFVWIAAKRAAYPFDLEWMEGGVVDHVARLLAGKPLYVAPTVDYVPFIYNPLYYVLAAVPTLVLGVSHLPLRLVSIVATLACFALVFALVFKETRQRVPALIATGMFAGSFALSGAWFDLARVDSTCLAFCLGAWYLTRFATRRRASVAAATLLALAFLTKQAAIALAPALVLSTGLLHGFRRTVWFLPVLAAVCAVMVGLELASDGWYSFYVFRVPAGFTNESDMIVDFWKKEIFSEFSMALVLGLYFAFTARDKIEWTAALKVHVPFVVSIVGMAYIVRVHSGSYWNDKMPAHAALSVAAGLGLARLRQSEPLAARTRLSIFGGLVALGQLLFLLNPPERWVPTSADVSEGKAFVATMKSFPGDVLTTHHGALTRLADKASLAQGMAVFDVVRTTADYHGSHQSLRDSFESAFASHRFSAVFTDDGLVMPDLLDRYYERGSAQVVHNGNALVPKTGASYRPRFVYVPRH